MKKTSIMMAPLFAAVVMLLSIGAVGELFASLFARVKNLFTLTSSATQTTSEQAVQLK
ncbi:MAG: hypothetical protein L3J61_04915 [Ghiorsea sp.]|nr:hypothetical protein [Ghiorsea sp.]